MLRLQQRRRQLARIDGWRNDLNGSNRRKLIHRGSFRASVLHHSDAQAVGNHCTGVLCLDNAFVLIERHPVLLPRNDYPYGHGSNSMSHPPLRDSRLPLNPLHAANYRRLASALAHRAYGRTYELARCFGCWLEFFDGGALNENEEEMSLSDGSRSRPLRRSKRRCRSGRDDNFEMGVGRRSTGLPMAGKLKPVPRERKEDCRESEYSCGTKL